MSNVRRNLAASAGLVALGLLAGVMIAQIGSASAGTGQQAVNRGAPALDEVVPQGAFVRVVEDTRPALVYIETEQTVDPANSGFFGRFFDDSIPDQPRDDTRPSLGSGFLISADGYILTNGHVVSQVVGGDPRDPAAVEVIRAEEVTVFLGDDEEYTAEIIGVDIGTDLAVLKIDAGNNLPFIPFGDSDSARVGEWVLAMGAPFGLTRTVTAGIISAKGRAPLDTSRGSTYQDFIQTDAQINPGNSGGPMVNLHGEVIGINTAIITNSLQGTFSGVGFAIPVNLAKGVVEQIIEHGRTIRGWLGISMRPLDEGNADGFGLDRREVRGAVIISTVNPGEPADMAGVREGDIVVATGGVRLEDNQDFLQRIGMTPPDAPISLDIIRMEAEGPTGFSRSDLTIEVTLGERPPETEVLASQNADRLGRGLGAPTEAPEATALQRRIGMTLAELTERIATDLDYDMEGGGVVIARIDPDGPFVRQQVQFGSVGSIIRAVNSRPVSSIEEFEELVGQFDAGDTMILTVRYTSGVTARVPFVMPEAR